MAANCTHLDQIRDVTPSAQGCEECLQTGDTFGAGLQVRPCMGLYRTAVLTLL